MSDIEMVVGVEIICDSCGMRMDDVTWYRGHSYDEICEYCVEMYRMEGIEGWSEIENLK